MTTTELVQGRSASTSPGLAAALASEADKLRSWPAARWLVGLALLLAAAGSAAFIASAQLTVGTEVGLLGERDRLTISLLGLDLANVTMIVVAVLAVSAEASSGQMALTLQATPRRTVVFGAKVVVLSGLALLVSALATALALGAGQLALLAHGVSLPGLASAQVLRLVLVTALMIPLHVAFAAALAFCFRSAGVALAGVFVIMCLPSLARLLPDGLGSSAQWLLPAPSLHTLSGASLPGDPDYTAPWAAAAVLLGWVMLLLAVALRTFRRRDF